MAFRVSPGVSIKEIDLTTIVPAVATTPGGYAGYFHWGPTDEIVTITQQTELANVFGKPQNDNYTDFFTVGNFLGYGNNMQVVRVVNSGALNAASTKGYAASPTGKLIKNETDFLAGVTNGDNSIVFAAKYPGILGNSLKVVAVSGSGIQSGLTLAAGACLGHTSIRLTVPSDKYVYLSVGDEVIFHDGTQATVSGVATSATARSATAGDFFGVCGAPGITLTLSTPLTSNYSTGYTLGIKSVYAKYVTTTATTTQYATDVGGSNDLVTILVLDKNGQWTGTENTLLEKFEGTSRAFDAKAFDGSSNYYKTVVNDQSAYVWALSHNLNTNGLSAATSTFADIGVTLDSTSAVGFKVSAFHLGGGTASAPNDSERWASGWSKFQDADAVDVSLLPLGSASNNLARLVVQNVCEKRLDCMAFVSPGQTDVENKLPYEALNSIKTFRDTLNINSSYAVIDSGWKYQLDTYNNLIRVMPLNPDIAGLVARTEFTNEAWFSPAGFNRGQIKGVVKLAYNPTSEAHRDELYTRQVNPVVSFPGEGVILFGDKTSQTRPSAFDRINVRRLFIVLEKAIATASKFFLFEQNDAFTRAQFKNLVTPFLKTVQQRRGITDFKVVCDETNNTGEIIDRNEFVADIFIKPTRSINFISLNFIATKTGVSFSEVGG